MTGNDDKDGNLKSVYATKYSQVGVTLMGTAKDYYPGLGNDQNKFNITGSASNFNLNFEQHASVSTFEKLGMKMAGFNIVNLAVRSFQTSDNYACSLRLPKSV